MSDQIRVAIAGAAGRMGQRLIALGSADPALQIVAALEHAGSKHLGNDAGELAGIGKINVPFTAELPSSVDVVIDFSTPEGAVSIARLCAERRIALVEATTGLNPEQRAVVLEAAQETAVVQSPSMSLAVNVAMKLVGQASRALKDLSSGVDVEIIERHHRFKEDAPSGTALKFGQIVTDEMGQTEQ
ncbi:MAG TPA: 4-hydroxy-tetrahydrodipicolinate reductase, partial [Planctomicrobium sp.]|nr:4-hydroxy-tetrahydrodipicolinate reductase [Planctomicrobium sp.]